MDWKKEAEQKLRDYAARQQALQAIPQQIEAVRLRREGLRAVNTDTPSVVGSGPVADQMTGALALQEELENRLEVNRAWVTGVEAALDVLTDEERLVLDRFYIHPVRGSANQLCEELCLERASVYRRKDQALNRFVLALCG